MILFLKKLRACRRNTSTTPQYIPQVHHSTICQWLWLGNAQGTREAQKKGHLLSAGGIYKDEERLECDYFWIVFKYK